MADNPSVVWGVKSCFIRPGDGKEYKVEAAQEIQIKATAQIAQLMGDDSLVPLDVQPKKKEITIAVKNGKTSQVVETLMVGGTNVSNAGGTVTSPAKESVGSTMQVALTASLIAGQAANLVSDTWTFLALGNQQYQVIQSSTGLTVVTQTAAGYPISGIIPGVTFTVSGTITKGDVASITTAAQSDTVEISNEASNDFAAKVGLRCITESPSVTKGQTAGQFEWLFPVCQSEGLEWPLKTKDYAIMSNTFVPLYDPNIGSVLTMRKYSRQQ